MGVNEHFEEIFYKKAAKYACSHLQGGVLRNSKIHNTFLICTLPIS